MRPSVADSGPTLSPIQNCRMVGKARHSTMYMAAEMSSSRLRHMTKMRWPSPASCCRRAVSIGNITLVMAEAIMVLCRMISLGM